MSLFRSNLPPEMNAVESPEGPTGDTGSCKRTTTTVLHRKALRRRYYWPCLGDGGRGGGGVEWANDRRIRKRPSLEMQRWKRPGEEAEAENREVRESPWKSGKSSSSSWRRGHYHSGGRRLSLLVSIQVAILLLFMSAWDTSTWVHAQG